MALKPLCARHCEPRQRKREATLPGLKKLLLIMNLTAILLLATALQVSAIGHAQKITLAVQNVSLDKVFKEIKNQTNYTFFYTDDQLQNANKVTLNISDASIEQVLELCFQGQPFTYQIIDKMIVVKQKANVARSSEDNEATKQAPPAVVIDVSGKITDEDGNPLMSATVSVKGTNIATKTNADGFFVLKGVDENATLEISYVGFEKKSLSVASFKASNNLALKRNDSPLDEVQVQAYGTTSRRFSTGNISTVKAIDIEKQPVNNPLLALQGRVPGLFITQASGVAGTALTVRIQGQNSIGKGNEPLYVIDGVPYVSQLLSTAPDNLGSILGSASGSAANGNPLSYINPSDIESIDVLKDADATAIYGSRGANGVILITTKKGKAGPTKVDINIQSGWGKITRKLDLLNTQQYVQMRHEAIKNDNAVITPTDYDINGTWDTTRYTDWQKELIGGGAHYTDVQTTISGGNTATQYLIGTGYHKETTVFPGDFANKKANLHFSINSISSNQKFRVLLSGSYLFDNNKLPRTDFTSSALQLAPNAPSLFNADGSLNWAPNSLGRTTWTNNIHPYTLRTYNTNGNNLVGNAVLSYQILPGLDIRSSLGYTNLNTTETILSPLLNTAPQNQPNATRFAIYANNIISSWIIEPQISYKKAIRNGKFEVLIGTTIHQNSSDGQVLFGRGYNSDAVLKDLKSASSVTIDATTASVYRYNAIFGRINYNLQDKYIINISARRDGSSRFGPENQFHNFGAAGFGWIFSNENFIKNNLSFLSFGKIRGSYGTTGNDQIGDYQFLNLYSPMSVGVSYQNTSGLDVNGLTNPYLQWEETRKLQFGLDLGLFKDRILLTANYFHNRSSNQLLIYSLPITTGFSGITRNFPATVQNSGWEFSLSTINIKTKEFNWSSSINLTVPRNKLVAFPNLATSSYGSFMVIGQPVSIIKGFHFLGVNSTTGAYQFANSQGDPTSSPNSVTDQTALINTLPKFYGGIQNSFSYKGIQLDVLLQFVKQIGKNYSFGNPAAVSGAVRYNQPTSVINRWQRPGDITSIQRYNSNFDIYDQHASAIQSNAGYSDASYMRMKNLSLSWQLPERWRKKMHLQNCRLYVHGQNLLTITDYQGLDPESLSPGSLPPLPPLRVLTFGIQITL